MSRRRPRISECRSVQDFVRAGVLRPVRPTTATGFARYGAGRLFLTAAHASNDVSAASILVFAESGWLTATAGTIALRTIPVDEAFGTLTTANLVTVARSGDASNYAYVLRHVDPAGGVQLAYQAYDGSTISFIRNTVAVAAGATANVVARHATTTLDLNVNGTDIAQATNSSSGTTIGTTIRIGSQMDGTRQPISYVGPVIISPTRKSDTWVTAIQASSGAAYTNEARLIRDFLAVGDFFAPLNGNSVAYTRVR